MQDPLAYAMLSGMPRLLLALVPTIVASSAAHAMQDVDGSFTQLSVVEQAIVEKLITDKLRDPVAAQYRRVRTVVGSRDRAICGEVNVKNGYGGYVGFEPFAIAQHPDGKTSTYNPHSVEREMRPLMRRIIGEIGCVLSDAHTATEPTAAKQGSSTTLLKRWATENEACRGGAGDSVETDRTCERREAVSARLAAQGWCYGREGEYGYQKDWHRCGLASIRPRR